METRGKEILSLLLLIGLCIVFLRLTTQQTDRDGGVDADGQRYITMAGDTTFPAVNARIAPFCYRIATPWIASKLPGETFVQKFKLLALLDAFLILLLTYGWLRLMGFEHAWSMLGVVLLAGVFWTLKFTFFSSVYIDHQTLALILLAFWISAKGWWFLLPPLIFGAYFQKESIIAIAPVLWLHYLHLKGWKWWPLYLLGILLLAASVVPHFILQNNIHPVNKSSASFAIGESWRIVMETKGYAMILIVAIFSGLGIMPLFLLTRLRWTMGYLKQNPAWIAMILIGIFLLFGGRDKARLFMYMVPTITLLTLAALRDMHQSMPKWTFRAWVAILLILHTYIGCWWTSFQDFDQYLDWMVPEQSGNMGLTGFSRVTMVALLFFVAHFFLFRLTAKPLWTENRE